MAKIAIVKGASGSELSIVRVGLVTIRAFCKSDRLAEISTGMAGFAGKARVLSQKRKSRA